MIAMILLIFEVMKLDDNSDFAFSVRQSKHLQIGMAVTLMMAGGARMKTVRL